MHNPKTKVFSGLVEQYQTGNNLDVKTFQVINYHLDISSQYQLNPLELTKTASPLHKIPSIPLAF